MSLNRWKARSAPDAAAGPWRCPRARCRPLSARSRAAPSGRERRGRGTRRPPPAAARCWPGAPARARAGSWPCRSYTPQWGQRAMLERHPAMMVDREAGLLEICQWDGAGLVGGLRGAGPRPCRARRREVPGVPADPGVQRVRVREPPGPRAVPARSRALAPRRAARHRAQRAARAARHPVGHLPGGARRTSTSSRRRTRRSSPAPAAASTSSTCPSRRTAATGRTSRARGGLDARRPAAVPRPAPLERHRRRPPAPGGIVGPQTKGRRAMRREQARSVWMTQQPGPPPPGGVPKSVACRPRDRRPLRCAREPRPPWRHGRPVAPGRPPLSADRLPSGGLRSSTCSRLPTQPSDPRSPSTSQAPPGPTALRGASPPARAGRRGEHARPPGSPVDRSD
jgi:hypothetical protein